MTPNNNTQSTHRLGEPGELARTLARLGLLPFVLGTLLIWLLADHVEPEPYAFVVQSVASYAALVVAFLAGMPWGLAALRSVHEGPKRPEGIGEDKATLRWSVALISAAWMALLMPPHAGLAALGALLVGSYLVDRKRYPLLGAAGWLKLRFRLTVLSSLCCFLAAAQLPTRPF